MNDNFKKLDELGRTYQRIACVGLEYGKGDLGKSFNSVIHNLRISADKILDNYLFDEGDIVESVPEILEELSKMYQRIASVSTKMEGDQGHDSTLLKILKVMELHSK